MSEESVEEDGRIEITRRASRRSLASNSKQQSALERLKQARSTGKFRARVDDLVQDVYMEVDDEEYQAKKQNYREFVEDDDGAGYYDEDSEDELDDERLPRKKKEEKKAKAKAGTIKHHFQVINNKQKPNDKPVRVDDDDILKECLADIVGTSNLEDTSLETNNYDDPFTTYAYQEIPSHTMESIASYEPSNSSATNINANTTRIMSEFRIPSPFSSNISDVDVSNKSYSHREQEIETFSPTDDDDDASLQIIPPEITPSSHPPNSQRKRDASPLPSPVPRPLKISRADENSAGALKFYFLDAFEDKNKHPGTVYLFGYQKTLNGRMESCCLVLRNITRQLFFLKREFSKSTNAPVTMEDLKKDIQKSLRMRYGITKMHFKKLAEHRFISADESVPSESQALEVWLNCNPGRIDADLAGDTFSCVMNTTTTALERLLVECKIYGPCWLEVRNAERADCHVSHCPAEYIVNMEQMDCISMMSSASSDPTPQITFVSINILTALNQENKENQIVMASLIHHTCNLDKPTNFTKNELVNKRYCIVSKFDKGLSLPFDLDDQLKKYGIGTTMVLKVGNEQSLLNMFLAKLEGLNPDMIIGHDLNAQLALLHSKMQKHNLKKWDRLGRLKRGLQIQKIGYSNFAQWELTAGRLCLDSKTAATELIHLRSYEIEDLVSDYLKSKTTEERQNLNTEQISETFLKTTPKLKLIELITWNWNENLYTILIVEKLNAIPLFVQITQIVGGVLSRTLMGGRAERNEYLLLHACFENNYIPPDKQNYNKTSKGQKSNPEKKLPKKSQGPLAELEDALITLEADENPEEMDQTQDDNAEVEGSKKKSANKKTQYTGGLVLEPKTGLYETFIVLLDFNSLYPSIIQEYNICFTTVDQAFANLLEAELPEPPGSSRPDGILKIEISKLVSKRREVKNLMGKEKPGSDKYQQYNIRQLGLKLTANSMYGCLGFQNSRFFAKTLAAMVTSKGRELLLHTKTLVENENFSVIYGDTDSIMVNSNTTDFQKAKQLGNKLKQVVNKNYSLLELDIDGIYKRLLLLKKKKYAALKVDLNDEKSMTTELKGLDIVRRDWSEVAKEIGEEVVNLILSSPDRNRNTLVECIKSTLAERKWDLDKGKFRSEKFEILKQLTRDPADYKDTKSQPHADIAIRLNESMKFRLRQGDIVKYIICEDGTDNPPMQRCYHVSEIIADKKLHVDKNYYLSQQIRPIVTRLCEPIEEIGAYLIAEILGLDPSEYARTHDTVKRADPNVKINLSDVFAPLIIPNKRR